MASPLFDILVPVGPNDIEYIHLQTSHCRKNIIGFRKLFIVTPFKDLKVEGCIVIDEAIFPFTMKDVQHIRKIHPESTYERNGWYLQQLLKLYAPFVIPEMLDTFLVVDSDTFFLKPTTFIVNGKCAYNPGREYNPPYFIHMANLHPSLTRQYQQLSGVTHHMIFEKQYVQSLMKMVEEYHAKDSIIPFWQLFLVFGKDYAGASEYEIYFNYMLKYYPEKIQIRPLKWANTRQYIPTAPLDYIAWHCHLRS
jgi:hypothetical protein